jgi:phage tail-like protein
MRRQDWLSHQLPVGMLDDEFLVRFLGIFQAVADTVVHQIDTLPHVFDPTVAPDPMVRTMGHWIGIDWVDSSLPDELQRRIVREYGSLIKWRGTKRGLRQLLEVISGERAIVTDSGGVYPEGDAPRDAAHVRLEVRSTGWATESDLLRIVRSELPASVTFELVVAGRTIWPIQPSDGTATTEMQEVH